MPKNDSSGRIATILKERKSSLAEVVAKSGDILSLDRNIREKVVDELTSEFESKGLRKDSEPNQYGLEIEGLIDACKLSQD